MVQSSVACLVRGMGRAGWVAGAVLAGLLAPAGAAQVEQQALHYEPPTPLSEQAAYHYKVEHPRYGNIGTYINVIKHLGDDIQVESEIHVAVKVLGMVMFRQEGKREEYWHNDRLVSFRGVTITNGNRVEVSGEAQGNNFVVTSPSGTIVAPGNTHPSNPWSIMVLNTDSEMSTKDGRVVKAAMSGGDFQIVSVGGGMRRLREFRINDDTQETIWFDEQGVPQAFRAYEDGTPIDFILVQ